MLPRQPQAVLKRGQKHAGGFGSPLMTITDEFLNDLLLAGDRPL